MRQIGNNLDAQNEACGNCEAVSEIDWIVNDSTVLRPDIAIVCDWTIDYITRPPILIVEILSPSTALNDRHVKFETYQEQGVKCYIIANPQTKSWQSYILSGTVYIEQEYTTVEIYQG
jgi:Uma2 family endonuclease